MSYKDDINYKYVDNYDDGGNPPTKIGCVPFVIGIVIIIWVCMAMRSCGNSWSNGFEDSQYEYSILD